MKSRLRFVSVVVALSLVFSATAWGTNEELGYGARGIAMGQAQTAAANDYYAIFYNPAALGLARE